MNSSPTVDPSPQAASLLIEKLRLQHQVRPLDPREEGAALGSLSNGVYGYTYAPVQDEVPVFSRRSFHSFEIHKAADGAEYLIGFVTASEAQTIQAGTPGASIRLFPDPWENSDCVVSVLISPGALPKRLPREDGNPVPITIS